MPMSPDELFGRENETVLSVVGVSMRPLLLPGRDTAVLGRVRGELKPGDVALYERPGGTLVLHRVLGTEADGYVCLGDNQDLSERERGVARERMLGVMTGFFRGSRYHSVNSLPYRIYRWLCLGGKAGRRALRGLWRCSQAWNNVKNRMNQ